MVHARFQAYPEEVVKRVDRTTDGDDEAHGVVGAVHSWAYVGACSLAGLAHEYLEEDEGPVDYANGLSSPRVYDERLTQVSEHEHDKSANQQTEERAHTEI